ncbi:MAG: hypothetical protein EOO96_08910 [Pedobacter sp.]|nr:MAG: hypothetical protein EOO96_08910 [Pedobacter sp.]
MKNLIIFLIITLSFGCSQSPTFTKDKMLTDFLAVDAIEKAEIHNNYGTFLLNKTQLESLKTALKKMSYEPDQAIKAGSKGITFTILKKEYHLSTITNGVMAEITIDNETLVFKTNGLNLDNYEKN